jgi:hypothetical protein
MMRARFAGVSPNANKDRISRSNETERSPASILATGDWSDCSRRAGVAEQSSPRQYLTHLAREAERMGYTHSVIGDRLEAGLDPFSMLTTVAQASGRMH